MRKIREWESGAQDGDEATGAESDDRGGGCWRGVVAAVLHHIVNSVDYQRVNLVEEAGGGGSADVGRRGYDGASERGAEARRERLGGDADADASVGGKKFGSESNATVVDDGGGSDRSLDELVGDFGDIVDVGFEPVGRWDERYEGLRVGAVFDRENAPDGLGIGCVTADSPDSVGGIEDDAATTHDVDSATKVGGVERESSRGFVA